MSIEKGGGFMVDEVGGKQESPVPGIKVEELKKETQEFVANKRTEGRVGKKDTGKLISRLEQEKAAEEARKMVDQHFETAGRMAGLSKKKPEVPPGEEVQ